MMTNMYDYTNECALLINTSNKYVDALRPYLELVKRYWKNHPNHIYLNCETKDYNDDSLQITVFHETGDSVPWSERLLNCLERIKENYIFFSLKDFFLLGYVDDKQIEKCLNWMKKYDDIAVCRLKSSSHPYLTNDDRFDTFKVAGSNVGYRLDTQMALWRKQDLINFIDATESPWGFEEKGTLRIINTSKIFLWHYAEDENDLSQMIFPYHITQTMGYGIAWGKWLWNNRDWFKENGIEGIKYYHLGTISERIVHLRIRYLYRPGLPSPKGLEWIMYQLLLNCGRVDRFFRLLFFQGGGSALSTTRKWIKKRK